GRPVRGCIVHLTTSPKDRAAHDAACVVRLILSERVFLVSTTLRDNRTFFRLARAKARASLQQTAAAHEGLEELPRSGSPLRRRAQPLRQRVVGAELFHGEIKCALAVISNNVGAGAGVDQRCRTFGKTVP